MSGAASVIAWVAEAVAATGVIAIVGYKIVTRSRVVTSRAGARAARIVVRDARGHRELWLVAADGRSTLQSRTTLADPLVSGIPYTDGFHLFPPRAGGRCLFVGAGAAIAPRQFVAMYPDVEVVVVEHDPEVISVAARYFGLLPSPRLSVEVADGRAALARSGMWSFIAVDAFGAGDFPAQLATLEFFEACRAHLATGGVLAVNLAGTLAGPVLRRVKAGIVAAFGADRVVGFGVPALDVDPSFHPRRAGNTVVFAFMAEKAPLHVPAVRAEGGAGRLRFLQAIAGMRLGAEDGVGATDGDAPFRDESVGSSLPIQ